MASPSSCFLANRNKASASVDQSVKNESLGEHAYMPLSANQQQDLSAKAVLYQGNDSSGFTSAGSLIRKMSERFCHDAWMCLNLPIHPFLAPDQVVRWISPRPAAHSWHHPYPQLRWCTGALSSTRDQWHGGPWPHLPRRAPSPRPPASLLSVKWRSQAPAPHTRRPCTTAYPSPAAISLSAAAAPRLKATKLLPGQLWSQL